MAAVEAGVDAIGCGHRLHAGLTSQPCLGSLVEALADTDRATGLDVEAFARSRFYFEAVRADYRAFESDLRFGASEVYLHEMPGGQFTILKEQARSLGLEARWHEVARTYAEVNMLFGDIVKVTRRRRWWATSPHDGRRRHHGRGSGGPAEGDRLPRIGGPDDARRPRPAAGRLAGGAPEEDPEGATPITVRPGSLIPPADLEAERKRAEEAIGYAPDDRGSPRG